MVHEFKMGATISQYVCTSCSGTLYAKEGNYYPTEKDAEKGINGTTAPTCAHCQQPFAPNIRFVGGVFKHLNPLYQFLGDITEEAPALVSLWNLFRSWSGSCARMEWIRDWEFYCQILLRLAIGNCLYEFILLVVWLVGTPAGILGWFPIMDLLNFFRLGFPLSIIAVLVLFGMVHFIRSYIQVLEADVNQKGQALFLSFNAFAVSTAVKKLRHRFMAINNTYSEAFNLASGLLSVVGLAVTVFGSSGNHFFYLYRAWVGFAGLWPNTVGGIQSLFNVEYRRRVSDSILGEFFRSIRPFAGWISAFALICTYNLKGIPQQPKNRKMDIRRKKDQEFVENVDDFEPVNPREVNSVSLVTIPNNPAFINANVVHRSLVQIQGNYTATAFRAGNYIVTAIHCLTTYNKGYGAWLFDPNEKKFYWAPLASRFKYDGTRIAGDGIAVLHLPQSNYFLARMSCPVGTPVDGTLFVATYLADNNRVKPNWAISTGNGVYRSDTNNITLWSSVESGSSGGPVLHTSGAVLGVIYAENAQHNIAFGLTKDVISFLARAGGVQPKVSVVIPSRGEYIRDFTRISKHDESFAPSSQRSVNSIDGPILPFYLNSENFGSMNGISIYESEKELEEELGKDKKKKKERQEKREGTIPDDEPYLSSNNLEELQQEKPAKGTWAERNARFKKKQEREKAEKERQRGEIVAQIHAAPVPVEPLIVGEVAPAVLP